VQQIDQPAGDLAEDPIYEAGRPVRVVLVGQDAVVKREGKRYWHQISLPGEESLIDPFKDRLRQGDRVIESVYKIGDVRHHRFRREGEPQRAVFDQRPLPRLLFVGAALMTLFTLILLNRQMPDLVLQTALWTRLRGRYRLTVHEATNLPAAGPAVLVSNAPGLEAGFQVLSSTDRTSRFVFLQCADERSPGWLTRWFASIASLLWLPEEADPAEAKLAKEKVVEVLARGEVLGLPLPDPLSDSTRATIIDALYAAATTQTAAVVVPAYYLRGERDQRTGIRPAVVVFGQPMPAGVTLDEVRKAVRLLGAAFREQTLNGNYAKAALTPAH
jgi:hypothetical protein